MSPPRPARPRSRDAEALDALVQLSFTVVDLLARAAARHDVSVTQVRLLGILRDREPAMSDLGSHLALEKSSVSGLVDRAERRGLVVRTTGHADRRAVHVRLTDRGAELATRFADEVYVELETLLAPLSDRHQRQLAELAGLVLATRVSPFARPYGRSTPGRRDPA